MLTDFTPEAVFSIDAGRVRAAFARALSRIIDDLNDRPALEKPRKIKLEFSFLPVGITDAGDCETCTVQVGVSNAIPAGASPKYTMKRRPDGVLQYADLALDDPDQKTVEDVPKFEVIPGKAPSTDTIKRGGAR